MKIEVYPRPKTEGFTVCFEHGDLPTVSKIRTFIIALLSSMGYKLDTAKIEEEGKDLLLFSISGTNENHRLNTDDLLGALGESLKRIKDDRSIDD